MATEDNSMPWEWNDVILPDFKEEYFDWCKARALLMSKDFYLQIDDPIYEKNDTWPFKLRREMRHHYFFKDPAIATAFTLTFLT